MSCCNETPPTSKAAERAKSFTTEEILANLPQVVIAPTDPKNPLASSIRNAMPMPGLGTYSLPKVHDDGSIEYAPVDAKPPPEPNGYQRDPQNPWLFRPQWLECQLRMAGVRRDSKAGTIDVKMVCNNPEVPQFMRFVKTADCAACTQRKNPT